MNPAEQATDFFRRVGNVEAELKGADARLDRLERAQSTFDQRQQAIQQLLADTSRLTKENAIALGKLEDAKAIGVQELVTVLRTYQDRLLFLGAGFALLVISALVALVYFMAGKL